MTASSDPTITCQRCKAEVRLTESLAAPLVEVTKASYEAKLRAEPAAIARADWPRRGAFRTTSTMSICPRPAALQ